MIWYGSISYRITLAYIIIIYYIILSYLISDYTILDYEFYKDIVPPVGDFSPHYVDFHEFKYFLIYIQARFELNRAG